jgi:hypothetical protein
MTSKGTSWIRKMSSGNIALAIWEDLMESRLYGPGRHQSFPVFGSVSVLVRAASSKSMEATGREGTAKRCNSQRGMQDSFQHPRGAFLTTLVI